MSDLPYSFYSIGQLPNGPSRRYAIAVFQTKRMHLIELSSNEFDICNTFRCITSLYDVYVRSCSLTVFFSYDLHCSNLFSFCFFKNLLSLIGLFVPFVYARVINENEY